MKIAGVDEAGRGPLAGPVAAGAAILPKDCQILYLNDSKKLSESRREELFLEIKEKAIAWSVGIVGPERIDEINILQATYEAMRQAIIFGSVMASFTVEAFSLDRLRILDYKEIEARFKEFKRLTHFEDIGA